MESHFTVHIKMKSPSQLKNLVRERALLGGRTIWGMCWGLGKIWNLVPTAHWVMLNVSVGQQGSAEAVMATWGCQSGLWASVLKKQGWRKQRVQLCATPEQSMQEKHRVYPES